MNEETGAAAPTDEQAVTAPAESEPATTEAKAPETEEAAPPNAETQEDKPEQTEEAPRRLSRSQRQQRKIARLSTMLVEREAELQELRSKSPAAPQPPKEEDFNGDWLAFQRAVNKYDTEQIVNSALEKVVPKEAKPDVHALNKTDLVEDLKERIDAARQSLPDFHQSLANLQQHIGDLSEPLLEEIGESEKGEFVLYHLAKNPQLAASINKMSPREVAREVARLESKVSLPQPRKQTQAPAPMTVPTGGASKGFDPYNTDDMDAYVKWRKANLA